MTQNERKIKKLIKASQIMIRIRWFYLLAIALTGVISKAISPANISFSPANMAFILFSILLLNAGLLVLIRKQPSFELRTWKMISAFQILADQTAATLAIYYGGGIISVGFLYLLYGLVASAFFFSFSGVMLVATLDSIVYAGLLYGEMLDIIPYIPRYALPAEYFISHNIGAVTTNTFAVTTSFFVIAAFVGLISNSLLKHEDEIYQEKEKEDVILSEMQDGLLYFGKDNKLEVINPQAQKILDIKAENIIGLSLQDLKKSDSELIKNIALLDSRREKELAHPDKPDMSFLASSAEVRSEDGKLIGTIKLVRDVSRQKHVNKMKSEFITIAGHQLRTPLSAVKGALNLLKEGDYGPVNEDQKKVLEKSYEYNDRLIKLVNDLLDVSQVEEGRYDYKFEKTDLHNILRQVCEQFSAEVERKRQRLKLNIVNNLSDVSLDPYKFKLALGTLINNAITYTPKQGEIEVRSEFKDERRVRISVSDNGIGIPEDQQENIFTKFFRAENALRVETEGNGLDLFVAKNIVENHQGKIWFKSVEGRGTRFFIELPVEQGEKRVKKVPSFKS